METNDQLIPADLVCVQHKAELSFLYALQESGLIQVVLVEEQAFLPSDQMQVVEKFIRLHYDLEINLQGLEAISHLLQQVEQLQKENRRLHKRLQWFESLMKATETVQGE